MKEIILLTIFLISFGTVSAACYPPIGTAPDCQEPENKASLGWDSYRECLVKKEVYEEQVSRYNACAENEMRGVSEESCKAKADQTYLYSWNNTKQECVLKCASGYYLTQGGACREQRVTVSEPTKAPETELVTESEPQPTYEPTAEAPKSSSLFDMTPVKNLFKKEQPSATEETQATAQEGVLDQMQPVEPPKPFWRSFFEKLNPFNWF